MNQQQPQVNIDLKNTTPVISEDGNQIFAEGVILRKVSKFVSGTAEDGIMPIPVFYDVATGKVVTETLPKDIRDEFVKEEDGE